MALGLKESDLDFYGSLAFSISYTLFVLYVIVVFIYLSPSAQHRHKLDPCDMKMVDDDMVAWLCWDCGETLHESCGVNICATNDVVKRPGREGSLWGEEA